MRINVAQLLKQPIGETRDYTIGETAKNGSQIEGEVKLLRTDRGILVSGVLKTKTRCLCSRCLEEFDQPLNLEIEEEYFPTVDVTSGISTSVPDEADGFVIDENHEIDLGEAVRQYTLLDMPMKPVCRPDCRGLCPVCGANLNYGACTCSQQPSDPRWTGLERLVLIRDSSEAERKGG